jgi:hypothetical protein
MNIQRLTNKVRAKNLANATRNWHLKSLAKLAQEFAGQKILLAGSTNFTAKFSKAIKALELPCGKDGVRAWISTSAGYSICFQTSVSVTDGGHTCYQESYVFFGYLSNGVLTPDHNNAQEWRVDFTVDEILKAREDVNTARAAMQAAESRLQGFGEGDNN